MPEKMPKTKFIGWSKMILTILICLTFSINIIYADMSYALVGQGTYKTNSVSKMMVPASIQKIVTMYLAWNILGKNHRFKTELTEISNNLYQIDFSFDPSFKDFNLEELLRNLPRNKKINLYIVSNGLTQPYHPTWENDDIIYCYASPLGPAIINDNCAKIKSKNPKNNLKFVQKPYDVYKYLPNYIQRLAIKNGIEVQKVIWSMKKRPGKIIATHYSEPLNILMVKGLKMSNNLIMDSYYLASAQKLRQQRKIRWDDAQLTINEYFIKKIPDLKIKVEDGSGLSPKNLININTLNKIMSNIEKQSDLFNWALKSLPSVNKSGGDGTLRKRFQNHRQSLKVMTLTLKTGTFNWVRNYCGWITVGNKRYRLIWLEQKEPRHFLRSGYKIDEDVMNLIESTYIHINDNRAKKS